MSTGAFIAVSVPQLIGRARELEYVNVEEFIDIDKLIEESEGKIVRLFDSKNKDRDILSEIKSHREQLDRTSKDAFDKAVLGLIESSRRTLELPDMPLRPYQPRESIIDYIRSSEGFGPWLQAGCLSRPLIRDKSPKAYMALANWLRNNNLPADLPIPTKSETTNRKAAQLDAADPAAIKAARALYERQRYASLKQG